MGRVAVYAEEGPMALPFSSFYEDAAIIVSPAVVILYKNTQMVLWLWQLFGLEDSTVP